MEERALQPICAWTMDEAFDDYIEFVVDEEDRYSVDAKDVTIHSLVPEDSLSYGSRQVGGGKGPSFLLSSASRSASSAASRSASR